MPALIHKQYHVTNFFSVVSSKNSLLIKTGAHCDVRFCFKIFIFFFHSEIEKFEGDELRKDGEVKKYLDIISNKNIKLSERVLIPVQQYPKVRPQYKRVMT